MDGHFTSAQHAPHCLPILETIKRLQFGKIGKDSCLLVARTSNEAADASADFDDAVVSSKDREPCQE